MYSGMQLLSMQKEIALGNQKIIYTIRKSPRARRVRMAVYPDGRVVVTLPSRASESHADRFVREKSAWLLSKIKRFGELPLRSPRRHSRAEYLGYKEAARTLVHERIAYLNQIYRFRFNRVSIKNQKTCWGSCSKKANLNFNYRIVLLPVHLADYVIVHELCHLAELNHSRKFWDLVARSMPDHASARAELRKTGMLM